jgi:hypothetical protein
MLGVDLSSPLGLSYIAVVVISISDLTSVLIASSVILLSCSYKILSRRRKGPLPPGPRSWPIVGNLPHLPNHNEWETYAKWAKEYGECIQRKD